MKNTKRNEVVERTNADDRHWRNGKMENGKDYLHDPIDGFMGMRKKRRETSSILMSKIAAKMMSVIMRTSVGALSTNMTGGKGVDVEDGRKWKGRMTVSRKIRWMVFPWVGRYLNSSNIYSVEEFRNIFRVPQGLFDSYCIPGDMETWRDNVRREGLRNEIKALEYLLIIDNGYDLRQMIYGYDQA